MASANTSTNRAEQLGVEVWRQHRILRETGQEPEPGLEVLRSPDGTCYGYAVFTVDIVAGARKPDSMAIVTIAVQQDKYYVQRVTDGKQWHSSSLVTALTQFARVYKSWYKVDRELAACLKKFKRA